MPECQAISRPLDFIWLAFAVFLALIVVLRMQHFGLHIDESTGAGKFLFEVSNPEGFSGAVFLHVFEHFSFLRRPNRQLFENAGEAFESWKRRSGTVQVLLPSPAMQRALLASSDFKRLWWPGAECHVAG